MDAAGDYDIIVFLDDDFVPATSFFAEVEKCFLQHRDVVAASGAVIADGITGPGIEFETARALLRPYNSREPAKAF